MRAAPMPAAILVLATPLRARAADAQTGGLLVTAAVMVLLAAGVLTLALVCARDAGLLRAALRRAAAGDPVPAARPWLPPLDRLARQVARFAAQMNGRVERAERLLRAETALVEILPDPLIVLSADRLLCRANAAAREAYGADLQAVLRHPGLRGAIERARAAGHVHHAALSLPVPVTREVAATVINLDPPLADGGSTVIVLSDRTRERAVERMRADFVANASHELRTPLASVIGFIETLRGPAADDPAAQARFLGIMAEQAERMNRLIDDLLSLSRIEVSEHQLPSERVDLAELARNAAAAFEPRLAGRRITLETEIAPTLPDIPGDDDQLTQVLHNLLDNAVKYGREGGRIALRALPAGPGWPPGVLLSVADDGPGIPRAHLPRLTERFYRVDKGRSRAVGGTGLGLAIVKHVVNRHRGRLQIESEEGRGATFTVWLPAKADPA